MILLSSPLENDPPKTTVSIFFFLETEIVTTKIVNSKSMKKICYQLLSMMNVLKLVLCFNMPFMKSCFCSVPCAQIVNPETAILYLQKDSSQF